jgi:hypothetical protein
MQLIPFNMTAPDHPKRYAFHTIPKVTLVPCTSIAGTGHLFSDDTLENGTEEPELAAATHGPDWAGGREIVAFQSDASGSTLTGVYSITYKTFDGSTVTYEFTLTGTASQALPLPCIAVPSALSIVITNAAASDKIRVGYRGFHLPGSWPTAAANILSEAVDGAQPATAGTVPQAGIYLPNSVSAGNSISVGVHTNSLRRLGMKFPGASRGTIQL